MYLYFILGYYDFFSFSFFFSSRRRHTRSYGDWSSDVCSSDLLDALVYDLQDTGVRSYTFISTMGLAMEACAEAGVEFVVLDRPNPLAGERVEGPMVDRSEERRVGKEWRCRGETGDAKERTECE